MFVGVRTPYPGAGQGASCHLQAALQGFGIGGGNEEEGERVDECFKSEKCPIHGAWHLGGGNTFVLGNVEDAGCPREVTFENGI